MSAGPAQRALRVVVVPRSGHARAVAEALLPALRAALSGEGPPLMPVSDDPSGGSATLAEGEDDDADPTTLAVRTSGSRGSPRVVLLPASALLASAAATHERLGGPGRWLLTLPVTHIAGLQVLVRSLVARTSPVTLDAVTGSFVGSFVDAAGQLPGPRRYTALVPTQLLRLLEAGGAATEALAGFQAVLVGGAACPAELRSRALDAGIRLVLTYGSTETCGGCVYDGVTLPGVQVRIEPDDVTEGRILVAGPVLARGYLGESALTAEAFTIGGGARWFRTGDLGRLDGPGRLAVVGRLDDIIITGGVKVSPAIVEAALLQLPEVAEAVVVGVPDVEWGQRVSAAIVAAPGWATSIELGRVRAHVAASAGPAAAPRQVLLLSELPLRGPGKPDRTAIAGLLAADSSPVA